MDWLPPADITETDDAFRIALELCGVDRHGVDIQLTDGRLTISGVRETDVPGEVCHYRERPRGRFVRAFSFRTPVDDDAIEARLADGLLTVTVPKRRPTRVPLT